MFNVNSDEIVISGISGRFPESDDIYEFWEALVNGNDLTTSGDRRWPVEFMGLPPRCGNVKNADKFDAQFFETDDISADSTDPQLRIFYEVVYEAIIDAGIIPKDLRGSNTAIILGLCHFDTSELISNDVAEESSKTPLYTRKTPSILSQFFQFTGPAFEIDAACASSFSALFEGVQLMKVGHCDKLIIGGTLLNLSTNMARLYHDLKITSPDGLTKCLDASADGCCRSEAVVAIFVEKKKDAKRIYATIKDIQTNNDGFTSEGITFPSYKSQRNLVQSIIRNNALDPLNVDYVECHLTGTAAGDMVESRSLFDAYRSGSEKPIMFGCLKTNIGHTEEASALCAITKVACIFQKHCIPPNRNYVNPNPNIPELITHQIIPVLKKTPFNGELIPINSFGIGGVNTHAILYANDKVVTQDSFKIVDTLHRLVNISGRTKEGLEYAMNWIEFNRKDVTKEFLALLNDVSKTPIETGMYCRAFMILDKENVLRKVVNKCKKRRPLWFVFPGSNCQSKGIITELSSFTVFAQSLQKCANVMDTIGFNLLFLMDNQSSDVEKNIVTAFVSITSIQLALVDLLHFVGLKPEGIIGHSIGEIAAAYVDGCVTLEEAVLMSFYTAKCIYQYLKQKGEIVESGLSWEQIVSRCSFHVSSACDTSAVFNTGSESKSVISDFAEQLKEESLFSKLLFSSEMAFDSSFVVILTSRLAKVIKNPKLNSSNVLYDAAYFASHITLANMFVNAALKIPPNACIVEVGRSGSLLRILKQCMPNSITVELMKTDCCANVENILSSFGQIYCTGNNVNIEKLYPKVDYPVPRETLSLSHLLKWDHTKSHFVANYTCNSNNMKTREIIDLSSNEWKFIEGHCIDGRILFPAAGYLFLVWRQYSVMMTGNTKFSFAVEFRNVMFERATLLSKSGKCAFDIAINKSTGQFTIVEDGSVCVTGYIGFGESPIDFPHSIHENDANVVTLKREEIYKELRILGFDYGNHFQLLQEVTSDGSYGKIKWNGNLITFFDTFTQFSMFSSKKRLLLITTSIDYMVCNPDTFYKATEYQNIFDVFFDKNLNQVTTNGICIRGIAVTSIQRRLQPARLTHQLFAAYDQIFKTSTKQQSYVEEYFEKCTILLQKLFLNDWNVTQQEEHSIFNIDANELYAFYKRLIVASKEKRSFEQFLATLTKRDKKTLIFKENFKDMFIVQLKQIMENMAETISILEVHDSESELKTSVIHCIQNYVMNYNYSFQEILEIDNKMQFSVNGVNIVIYKDASTELITDENMLKNEEAFSKLFNAFAHSMTDDGFLLFTHRNKLTSLERKIFTLRNLPCPQLLTEKNIQSNIPDCFTLIGKRSDDFGIVSCIFKKLSKPRSTVFIKPQYDCFAWVENLKSILKEDDQKVIWLIGNQSEMHGVIGLTKCLQKELGGGRFRCFISDNEIVPDVVLRNNLRMNFFKNGCNGVNIHQECIELKKDVEHSHLDMKYKGDLANFCWYESSHNKLSLSTREENNATLINVYYTSLNFEDVLIASEKIPQRSYPSHWHNVKNGLIGSEYSGIDEKGNKVMGIAKGNMITTTIVAKRNDLCWPVPPNWSLEEAATIPVVYVTVYYALLIRGKLMKNEKVFVHSGSCGIGQAAITVCLSLNCEVFTSVGTEKEKQFLKNKFPQLKESHMVLNGDVSFEKKIQKLTGEKGVDVVLNSLAEKKFGTSINWLAKFGRFIQFGNVVEKNTLDPSLILQNQSFHTVCIAHLLNEFTVHAAKINQIYDLIKYNLTNGIIQPISTTVFNKNEAEKATKYLASKTHIGKVLIRLRDEKTETIPKPIIISATPHTYCDPRKVYILFGGLGGVGLEVAVWLSKRGAKKLVITSRKGIDNDYQRYIINKIKNSAVTVNVVVNDASTYEKTQEVMDEALLMGPIGGIFNLAMALNDALVKDQTPDSFEYACIPKINITLYIDQISREMLQSIDYFVCFSSLASVYGNECQSNYGFANSVMESICEKRRKDGLHGVAIQFGPVGDTGAFNALVKSNDVVYKRFVPQRIPSILTALDTCMNSNYAIYSSSRISATHSAHSIDNNNLLRIICHILGVDHSSFLDDSTTLGYLGMDSFMALEVKQAIDREFDDLISFQDIRKLTIKDINDMSKNKKIE